MTNTQATIAVAVQQFVLGTLAACAELQPRRADGKPQAAIATFRVPGAQKVIPLLIDYARNGELSLQPLLGQASSARLKGLSAGKAFLYLAVEFETVDGRTVSEKIPVPYLSDLMRQVCSGEWTKFGNVEVQLNPLALLPDIQAEGDGAVIYPKGCQVRVHHWLVSLLTLGIWGAVTVSVDRIIVTRTGGQVIPAGWHNFAHVELEWGA